jgi:hypothetical protein
MSVPRCLLLDALLVAKNYHDPKLAGFTGSLHFPYRRLDLCLP